MGEKRRKDREKNGKGNGRGEKGEGGEKSLC